MKICFVTSSFPRRPGDHAAPWLEETAARLTRLGHSVEVFVPSHAGLRQAALGGTGVFRFRYAPAAWERLTHEDASPEKLKRSFLWRLVLLSYLVCGSFQACYFFLTRRFDVIVVHWPFPQGLFGAIGKLLGCPRLVLHFYASELLLIRGSAPLHLGMKLLMRFSDAAIAISSYTKALVEKELGGEPPAEVIPYGHSYPGGGRPAPATAPAPGEPVNLLYVGKLIERKGPLYLVDAVKLLKDAGVPVKLRMVGDGYLREQVLARIAENDTANEIELPGFVSTEALEEEYRKCHILVFPSIIDSRGDTEGQGLAPLDAMMRGRPAIASGVGGVTDLIKDGDTGYLVPEKDAAAIAAKVRFVRDNYQAALLTAENGRRRAAGFFDWDKVIAGFLKVYNA